MDPEEAVYALQDQAPRVMVPMHWWTCWLSREPLFKLIERARAAWAAAGRNRADMWDLQ